MFYHANKKIVIFNFNHILSMPNGQAPFYYSDM